MDITIEGLNERQRTLADIIWACDTQEDADRFIESLPTVALRQEAASIKELMILAIFDNQE